ncbi:protein of unknown function [Clostridium amylolyticum]|uniref:BppU N-terminal domain-containing protein n=1 Tax=Clostridium amylolyticum TaxID=1121298 RepID=A0A1M6KY65_9CLOT|nr:BppU family phage baseplate upper protein [Clostridium amylolyticum]SHJ63890.1 protein of unknown function [Clostridium amylolyticum]
MINITKQIYLDLYNKNCVLVDAKQLDVNTRFIEGYVTDRGMAVDLTGYQVKFYALKPDKHEIFNSVEILNAKEGKVKIPLTSQTLAVQGNVECELSIFNDSGLATSRGFIVRVYKTLRNDSSIESSNEFTALIEALNDIEEAKEQVGIAGEVNKVLKATIAEGKNVNEDLISNTAEAKNTDAQLQRNITEGKTVNTTLVKSTAEGKAVDAQLKTNTAEGKSTNEDLIVNISEGKTVNTQLQNNTAEGKSTNEILVANTAEGKAVNLELKDSTTKGKEVIPLLNAAVQEATTALNKIEEASNKTFIIAADAFVYNEQSGLWECNFKHNLESVNLVISVYNQEWKEIIKVCTVIDDNTVLLKTYEQMLVRVVINKSYINTPIV